MPHRLPDFVVIGSPRCGTTTLNSYLREHPRLHMAPTKELRFFTENWARGVDWYADRFGGAPQDAILGEASPDYLHQRLAIDRLARVLPEAALVLIVRDPIARANSHYHYRVARGLEPRRQEAAFRDDLEGGDVFPYLRIGLYGQHIEYVTRVCPSGTPLILFTEDLNTDAQSTLDQVVSWVGAGSRWPLPVDDRSVNSADRFRSVRLRRASRRMPDAARRMIGRLNREAVKYPDLPESLRDTLTEFFTQDVARLERLTGRSLRHWLVGPTQASRA